MRFGFSQKKGLVPLKKLKSKNNKEDSVCLLLLLFTDEVLYVFNLFFVLFINLCLFISLPDAYGVKMETERNLLLIALLR